MSEYEKKNNRGAAFNNKTKDKPTQPDMVGTALVDGKEKRLAVWKNKSSDGSEYLTFIFSDPLTEDEKNNFKKSDQPAQAPYKPQQKPVEKRVEQPVTNLKSKNNDIDDLQEILGMDDDTPF